MRSLNKKAVLCALAAVAALPLCAEDKGNVKKSRIELSLTAGPEWSHAKWFGPVRVVLTPQIAVWLERDDGRYAATLYVTEKSAKSSWGAVRRPEALPVWSHARGERYPDGLFMPTKTHPLPDALSGATPKPKKPGDRVSLSFPVPDSLPPGAYRLMVEINNSFDFNAAHPETRGNVNGQPSLVYAMPLEIGPAPARPDFVVGEPAGTGSPDGADGSIRPGTAGVDGALRILDEIKARHF
jgi:hypothetical protein